MRLYRLTLYQSPHPSSPQYTASCTRSISATTNYRTPASLCRTAVLLTVTSSSTTPITFCWRPSWSTSLIRVFIISSTSCLWPCSWGWVVFWGCRLWVCAYCRARRWRGRSRICRLSRYLLLACAFRVACIWGSKYTSQWTYPNTSTSHCRWTRR